MHMVLLNDVVTLESKSISLPTIGEQGEAKGLSESYVSKLFFWLEGVVQKLGLIQLFRQPNPLLTYGLSTKYIKIAFGDGYHR